VSQWILETPWYWLPPTKIKKLMSNNQMGAVAATAAIAQEPVTQTVRFSITGDTETDFIAAIMACFEAMRSEPHPAPSTDSNRMAQRVCEYLAGRFKAQAEDNDRRADRHSEPANDQLRELARQLREQEHRDSAKTWAGSAESRVTKSEMERASTHAKSLYEKVRSKPDISPAQSGTHSPSIIRPDSAAPSDSPLGCPGDGSVLKGPPPGDWLVADKF
jgi:hypothetical protein